ncbi:hypothetical protein [Geodermatophilus sp. SYSU D00815]
MRDQDTLPRRLLTSVGTGLGLVAMAFGAPVHLRDLTGARSSGHRR